MSWVYDPDEDDNDAAVIFNTHGTAKVKFCYEVHVFTLHISFIGYPRRFEQESIGKQAQEENEENTGGCWNIFRYGSGCRRVQR